MLKLISRSTIASLITVSMVHGAWAGTEKAGGLGEIEMSPKLGKYSCVSDFAVGIIKEDGKAPYAGRIELRETQKKFFITIQRNEINRASCKLSFDKMLDYEPPKGTLNQHTNKCIEGAIVDARSKECDADDPTFVIESCMSFFKAESDAWLLKYMRSATGVIFTNQVGSFTLYHDLEFTFDERMGRTAYTIQGRCEFIK